MAIEIEDPNYHAKLSPSSSSRWIACPGSVQANSEVKTVDTGNPDSRLGTAAHALLEACLLTDQPPQKFIGAYLAGKDHPVVDEDMCDWVQVALDYIEEYIDTYGEENLWVLPESRVYIGNQIHITGDDDRDDEICNGTSDCIIAHKDMSMCVSIDYKNGAGEKVDAKDNTQCLAYCAGARSRFGAFKKYKAVIIQPRAGKKSPIDEWEFTDAHLRKVLNTRFRPSAVAALLPNAPRSAGEHCRWCRASARCRTFKDKAYAAAHVEFSPIDGEPEDPDPERLTDEEFLEALQVTRVLEMFVHAVKAHALHTLQERPSALPGWKLGWTKRVRRWADEQGIIEFCQKKGLKPEEFMPRDLLTPAQMAKLLHRRLNAGKRRRRGEEPPPNPVEAFIEYSIPEPKLVHDDATMDAIED